MSLLPTNDTIRGLAMSVAQDIPFLGGAIGSLLGGGGSNVNLARNFSQRMGLPCTVRDDQKAAVTNLLNAGYSPAAICGQEAVPTPTIPVAQPGGAPVQSTGGPIMASIMGGSPMSALSALPKLANVGGVLRTAGQVGRRISTTGRFLGVTLANGRYFSKRDIGRFIRTVGDIATAAAILNITLQDAAEAVTAPARRRKGITHAQLRNAKRVACTISRMARDLNVKPAARRRTSCR